MSQCLRIDIDPASLVSQYAVSDEIARPHRRGDVQEVIADDDFFATRQITEHRLMRSRLYFDQIESQMDRYPFFLG